MQLASSPLSAIDAASLEQLHHQYREQPDSLDESWRVLFQVLDEIDAVPPAPRDDEALLRQAIRAHGHALARLDPLDPARAPLEAAALAALLTPGGGLDSAALARRYAGTLTVETAHIDAPGPRAWLQSAFEALPPEPPAAVLRETLRDLVEADEVERFLAKKFPTKKRFGAEGAEAVLPLLRRLLARAAAAGITHVVIGAMHRGRFNLLATVLRKPLSRLLAELKGLHPFAADPPRAADVPYHLGLETVLSLGGRELTVSLQPNPSHLEAVNAVALGRARALQDLQPVGEAWRVLPIVLHTDAAVVAQGVVGEMLQLSGPPGFSVGGAVHVVIDNRIGFTTEAQEARTSRHCTGPWKAIDSAILHVNGEDPAAVVQAAELALDWRLAQGRDAVIDVVCYRRHGHNEIDEPSFTQPLLYQAIARQTPVAERFADMLAARGLVTAEEVEAQRTALRDAWQRAYDEAPNVRPNESGYPGGAWAPHVGSAAAPDADTGVDENRLRALASMLATPPEGLALHPRIGRILRQREIGEDRLLAWPTAEALAFATLLTEGTPLRLTGQDVVRGAFSHRHFALADMATGARHIGLQHLAPDQARFEAHNSPLSEYAVLGFEYGYSLERPEPLAIWEAQFGTSPMAPRSPSTTSSSMARRSGAVPPAWCCCCRTGWKARGPSIPPPASSAGCNWRRATTCGSSSPRPRPTISICCAARCWPAAASRWWCSARRSCCACPPPSRRWRRSCPAAPSSR